MTVAIRLAVAIACGIAPIVPSVAVAQVALPTIGARVRVTAPALDVYLIAGTVVGATADTLSIAAVRRAPRLRIPVDKVSRLELSAGKNRVAGLARGAGWGLAVGALFGLGIAALTADSCGSEGPCGFEFVVFPVGGAGAGLIVGGIIGVAHSPDTWEEVPLRLPMNGHGMGGTAPTTRVGLSISL